MDRREATPIPHVGIDEKSFGKGHDSITVLTDVDGSRVLDVVQERTQAAAEAVLQTLTVEQRQEVRAVAADMLPAYAKAVARQTPNATLVHDKFHVSKYLGAAVDQVRRAENKALQAEGDERLKGTRHLPKISSYLLYRIPNATSEGFNSVIQTLKYAARGFRSFKNYRTRILFFCGRINLKPHLPDH